jgi:hypothetical protein
MRRPMPLQPSDRPDPVRPPLQILQHRPVPGQVSGEPAATQDKLVTIHHLDRDRPGPTLAVESGRRRYLELSKPLLSLFRPWQQPGHAGQMRATRRIVDSRCESDDPDARTEPC